MNRGRCLCGTVRYEIDGPFEIVVNCHCSMCRRHHGVPFVTWAAAPATGFRVTGGHDAIARYASSARGHRAFCRTCGSVTPELSPDGSHVIAPAGNLEGDLPRPDHHMFVASKASWHEIADELPQYEGWPPQYGVPAEDPAAVAPGASTTSGGRCLCGDVAYEVTAAPLRFMYCHCSRCRLARGAAHAANLFYPIDGFRWLRGAQHVREYRLPGAQHFATAFCGRCGSSLPRVVRERGVAVVPAGSLDGDPGLRAQAHIYVGSRASWDVPAADGIAQYEAMPPSPG